MYAVQYAFPGIFFVILIMKISEIKLRRSEAILNSVSNSNTKKGDTKNMWVVVRYGCKTLTLALKIYIKMDVSVQGLLH